VEVLLEAQVLGVQRRWLGRGRQGEKVVELVVVVFLILPSIIYWLLVGSHAVGVHHKDLAALLQKLKVLAQRMLIRAMTGTMVVCVF